MVTYHREDEKLVSLVVLSPANRNSYILRVFKRKWTNVLGEVSGVPLSASTAFYRVYFLKLVRQASLLMKALWYICNFVIHSCFLF